MTVKTDDSRGDIYKNDKNAELRCRPRPIEETDLYKCPIKPLQSDLDLIRDFVGQTSALDTLNQEICKHAFFYVTKWDKTF